MNIAKSATKLFVSRIAVSLLGFLGLIYFTNTLGATRIGVYFLFESLVLIFSIPANLGIQTALVKRMSEGEDSPHILSSALLMLLFTICIASVIIFVFRGIINEFLTEALALFLIPALILQQLSKFSIGVLKGERRVGETAPLYFIRRFIFVILSVILIKYGIFIKGLVFSFMLGNLVVFLLGMRMRHTPFLMPSFKHVKYLFDFSKYSFLTDVNDHIYSWLDVIVIGIFLSTTKVGMYETSWRITTIAMLFSNAINRTILPEVSNLAKAGSIDRIEELLSNSIIASLFFVLPAFLGTLLFSREILDIFGSEFVSAWIVLIILMGGKLTQGVGSLFKTFLSGLNRPKQVAIAMIVSMLVNIILNVVLVLEIGLIGAAVATTVSYSIGTLLMGYYLNTLITINIQSVKIAYTVFAGFGMMFGVYIANLFISLNTIDEFVVIIAIGVILYLSFTILSPPLRKNMIAVVRTVQKS